MGAVHFSASLECNLQIQVMRFPTLSVCDNLLILPTMYSIFSTHMIMSYKLSYVLSCTSIESDLILHGDSSVLAISSHRKSC